MGPSDSLSRFFEETEFDETHMAGGASPDDIFSILESLENIEGFPPVTPMADPGLGPKEGEETVKKLLVSQKSSSSSALAQESETDQLEASPKSKRQKITASTSSEEALANPDGSQRTSHITVERNRRKQMNEHLSVLRSLMPCFYVKRGDQASIIGGVVDYINELQQVLHSLEAKKQRKVYSEILSPRIVASSPRPSQLSPRKPPLSPRLINLPISPRTPQPSSPYIPRLHQTFLSPTMITPLDPTPPPPSSSSSSSSFTSASSSSSSSSSTSAIDNANELAANSKSGVAEVEVKFSGANVLLKTISRPIPGQAVKILSALEDLSLEILDLSINTVDETMLNSFTIKEKNNLLWPRTYGPRLAHKRAEYINAGLYLFATILLSSGFAALICGEPEPGLVLVLLALTLMVVVTVHDLVAHLAGIDYRFSLMGFDPQLALVEFAIPLVQAVGTLLTFLAILFLLVQAGDGYGYKLERHALNMLIAGSILWLVGSIHNSCQVYERADGHLQVLQESVILPFLMGSLLFLVGAILNYQEQAVLIHHRVELLGRTWIWFGFFGSLMFFVGGLANAVKVFKIQQSDGMQLEKLHRGAQERLVLEREGRAPLII